MLLTAVFVLLLVTYALLIGFYYRQWKRLKSYHPAAPPLVAVSVVVAARNEEKTLPRLLHDLQQQAYPSDLLEVIIVDDFSTDKTAAAANDLPPQFRMIQPDCPPGLSSKKKAIAAGVAAARHELILVTDADCRVGKNWVYTLASFYRDTGASFIAAPVKYTYRSSALQVLQVLDFITLQGITAASVSARFGTLCNGANLAYTKKAFEEVRGFEGIDQIPTGDDMLLMYKIWKQDPEKVFYLKSKEAVVLTAAVATWREFIMQRRRWASKTLVYDDKRLIVVLGFVLLLNLFPFGLFAAGLLDPSFFLYLLVFLLAKGTIEWPFVASVARFYNEKKLMRWFLLLQPLHVFYTVFVGISSQIGTYEWKGRVAPPPLRQGEAASSNPSREGLSTAQASPLQDASDRTDSSKSKAVVPATPPLEGGRPAG